MDDDNDKRNNRPGSRPAGGAPVRQTRGGKPGSRESRALLAPRSHSQKGPTSRSAASGRSATSGRPAAASPAASASSRPKPFAEGRSSAASDRRATSRRPTASPREAGSSRVAQSPSSSGRRAIASGARRSASLSRSGRAFRRRQAVPQASGPALRAGPTRCGSGRALRSPASGPRGRRVARPGRPPRDRPRAQPSLHVTRPPSEEEGAGSSERIAKRLARAGIASRRDAEELIAAGRVRVNGVKLHLAGLQCHAPTTRSSSTASRSRRSSGRGCSCSTSRPAW